MIGCTSKAPSASSLRQESELHYVDGRATPLAYDPPVTQGNPHLNLNRDAREASAFVGFDQSVTTVFYVRSDDQQNDTHRADRFERRAISEQFGTSVR